MPQSFHCLHSGKCCEKIYTQINITLGDILRIISFTNLTIENLFKTYIGLNPFSSENKNIFDIDLGLNIPCRFRKDKRCTIYKARPLNCRIFPYWLFAKVPEEHIKDVVDPSYECVHRIKLNNETRDKYKQYAEKIGNLILEESKITESMLKQINPQKTIDLSSKAPIIESKLRNEHKETNETELTKKLDEEKIKLCLSLLNKNQLKETLKKLTKKIEESKASLKFTNINHLEKIESLLKKDDSKINY